MSETKCVHCGADCGNSPVIWDEKPFCCHGCKAVYQILDQKKMGQYYEIQPMSGIRIEKGKETKQFAFLDLDEIKEKLLLFNDGNTSSVKLFLPGIHCASCIWLLEHLNTLHQGIIYSNVNFPKKEIYITFRNNEISLRQIAELLAAIHYVPEITLDQLEEKQKPSANRSLLVKIGIASFSFLNIMMYSFPEYVPGGHLLEQEFKHVFGWLSFVLILPVVFYSANDYYLSAWKGLKYKVISIDLPITLGIIALFLQSSYEVFTGNGIGYMDSLAGLLFFLLIGKWYQSKTYEALSFERDYKSYFPVAVTRILNGAEEIIPIKSLKKGDQIIVRNQELIPADANIVKGIANIDYSFVTGEAMPVPKNPGEFVFAGGRQIGTAIELLVEKEVEQSYLTQLWNQKSDKDEESRLNNTINNVSQYFTAVVMLVASISFFYWLMNDTPGKAVYVFASVLIIACPCALALTIPFTFGSTMRLFGRKGFYIKKTEVIEQLYRTTAVVFDKTGTITLNREVTINFKGDVLSDEDIQQIRSVVRHSSHPLSTTLNDYYRDHEHITISTYDELPGQGITAVVDNLRINVGSKAFVLGEPENEATTESRVYVGIDGKCKGYFSIGNRYRKGLYDVIPQLSQHYKLHLLSGDNDSERNNLREIFGPEAELHFYQTPTDKKAYIKKLKDEGFKVLMIGDGLNDAGALAESHTGISIADDVFSFSPACDAILESKRFGQLYHFLAFTKKSFGVIRSSFVLSFFYNLIGLSFAVTGMLSPIIAAILMPVSSVSVVAFATFSIRILGGKMK